jgi:hypothetical protein
MSVRQAAWFASHGSTPFAVAIAGPDSPGVDSMHERFRAGQHRSGRGTLGQVYARRAKSSMNSRKASTPSIGMAL